MTVYLLVVQVNCRIFCKARQNFLDEVKTLLYKNWFTLVSAFDLDPFQNTLPSCFIINDTTSLLCIDLWFLGCIQHCIALKNSPNKQITSTLDPIFCKYINFTDVWYEFQTEFSLVFIYLLQFSILEYICFNSMHAPMYFAQCFRRVWVQLK